MSTRIFEIFTDPIAREIVLFCKQPRYPTDIFQKMSDYYRGDRQLPQEEIMNRTAIRIQNLEKAQALEYNQQNNTWKSSETAIQTLAKYYGVR